MWASCITVATNVFHFVSILIKDIGDGQKQYGKSNLHSDFKIGTLTVTGDRNN